MLGIPGYDLLGAIARFGMRVVYKARQRVLDRPVTVEMIVAWSEWGAAERERFRRKAEAAARLQHPNIMTVLAVGEHDGQVYLVRPYAEGVYLSQKLGGQPQEGRQAAAWVEALARAVHHAHTQGIVHRDVKPANVFLTDEGVPLLTGFDCARLLRPGPADAEPAGSVVGTPSYMAPEQATGRGQDIGPATDVYGLGALLYELLTGRPPFRAATLLDTIREAIEKEPVPPRHLRPRCHHDLELICLKCLAKDPRQRYASAQDLAEDLRRFREDKPFRHVGMAERSWRWCRRNPAVAGLLVILAVSLTVSLAGFTFLGMKVEHYQRQAEEARRELEQLRQGQE